MVTVSVNLKLLKSLRELHCLSISNVASKLGFKTPTGFWLVETGKRNMSIPILYQLSLLYKTPVENLLIVKEEEEDQKHSG